MLRSQEKLSKSKWDKEKMQKRIGKMTGGVAVLRIGAATETEMKEKKARVDDALNATRAAMAEGVVVGGGVALLRARDALSKLMETSSGDRSIGFKPFMMRCLHHSGRSARMRARNQVWSSRKF